uniref:Pentatricopeptide repeat-containing protein n=1 Tax=Kalanchoe fedtschenkoi TaxID=63787 RepID=A0A7N0U6K7_KALFE
MALSSPPPTLHVLPATDPPYKLLQSHPTLALLAHCKSAANLKQLHSQFIKFGLHNTQFALSKLLEFCALSSSSSEHYLSYAHSVFESIEEPNVIIWNTMVRACLMASRPDAALDWYVRMVMAGAVPNPYTFPFVLKSCAKVGDGEAGRAVHGQVVKLGFVDDAFVHTSLINMYAQSGELDDARVVFDKSFHRDAVSFTALITGYTCNAQFHSSSFKSCLRNTGLCLSIVPYDIFRWVVAGVSGFMSASFVALNLRTHIKSTGENWVLIVAGIFLLQVALSVVLKLYLFTVSV